jgi:hypothetical protein
VSHSFPCGEALLRRSFVKRSRSNAIVKLYRLLTASSRFQVLLVAAPRQTELIARADVKAKIVDTALATELIRSAPQLSVSGLFKIVQTWKDNQISDLNSGMQTLAIVPQSIETQLQVMQNLIICTKCKANRQMKFHDNQSMPAVS